MIFFSFWSDSALPIGILVCDYFSEQLNAAIIEATGLPSPVFEFDRGSLVAIDPSDRSRYVKKLLELLHPLPASVPIFGVIISTFRYDQTKMKGPPHSVEAEHMDALVSEAQQLISADRTLVCELVRSDDPFEYDFKGLGHDTKPEGIMTHAFGWRIHSK